MLPWKVSDRFSDVQQNTDIVNVGTSEPVTVQNVQYDMHLYTNDWRLYNMIYCCTKIAGGSYRSYTNCTKEINRHETSK